MAVETARDVCFVTVGGFGVGVVLLDALVFWSKEGIRSAGGTGSSGPKAAGIVTPGTSISFKIPRTVSCINSQNFMPISISDLIFLAVRAFITSNLTSWSSSEGGGGAFRFLASAAAAAVDPATLGLLLTLTVSSALPFAAVGAGGVSFTLNCRTRCRFILCTLAVDPRNLFNACPPSSCLDTQSVLSLKSHFANSPGTSLSSTAGNGGSGFAGGGAVKEPFVPFALLVADGGGMLGCNVPPATFVGRDPNPGREAGIGAALFVCPDAGGGESLGGCFCCCEFLHGSDGAGVGGIKFIFIGAWFIFIEE